MSCATKLEVVVEGSRPTNRHLRVLPSQDFSEQGPRGPIESRLQYSRRAVTSSASFGKLQLYRLGEETTT